MPTGNKTEQYYGHVGQRVPTFSIVSHRERLPLSHRIRPPAWGGQRGWQRAISELVYSQFYTINQLYFQVSCQSEQASQHQFILCSYLPGSFSSCATVQKDFPSVCNTKNRWKIKKRNRGNLPFLTAPFIREELVIPSWKLCLLDGDLWCWSHPRSPGSSLK